MKKILSLVVATLLIAVLAVSFVACDEQSENDDKYTIVYLGDGVSDFQLELTWLKDRKEPYNLGENEFHTAFAVKDLKAALAKHKDMGCVVYQNPAMGIYFIVDPDGYWLEIIPER